MFGKFTAQRKTSACHNALAQTTQRFLTLQDAVPKFLSSTSLLFLCFERASLTPNGADH